MKNSIKGLLYSGLVFPGTGQLALGHKKSGIFFVALGTATLLVFVYAVMARVELLIGPLLAEAEKGMIDVGSVFEVSRQAATSAATVSGKINLFLFVSCWIISAIHAFWVGKKMDNI